MVRHDVSKLSFFTEENNLLAQELYGKAGFTIIRNFIPKNDVDKIILVIF